MENDERNGGLLCLFTKFEVFDVVSKADFQKRRRPLGLSRV